MKNINQTKKNHLLSKVRLLKISGFIKLNYLAWIANFGVVPLFLFAAFLFAPELFFLAALLFFVTLVLETIFQLLSSQHKNVCYSKLRRYFLPISGRSVKSFFVIFSQFLLLEYSIGAKESSNETVNLRAGEIKVIKIEAKQRYFNGNKGILKIKESAKQQELSLLALKPGNTVLHIYDHGAIFKKYFIKIIDARLESEKILEELQDLSVKVRIIGDKIALTGEVTEYDEFEKINQYIKSFSQKLILSELSYSDVLKKEIIAKVYQQVFLHNLYSANCFFDRIEVVCKINQSDLKEAIDINHLNKNFIARFEINHDLSNRQNFRFKIKIIQIENLKSEELSLGLNQLDTNLKEILNSPLTDIISKNSIKLKNANVQLSTLAEPEIICQLNEKSEFQLGNENPYKTSESQRAKIEWKFSGLKIEFKLQKYNEQFYLEYQSELTSPGSDQSINGSKGKSQVKLNLKSPIMLFQISMKNNSIDQGSMPFLGKIPIIGNLFKSQNKNQNMKSLYAIVEVSEYAI